MSTSAAGVLKCPNCQQPLHARYCAHCGEKRMGHHDLSIQHQAEELLEGFTHFDNKFFRTVKTLLLKPGELTAMFTSGVRVPYMKPFQLFIVCNLLFFLLQGSGNIFALPLNTYYQMQPYQGFGTQAAINAKLGGKLDLPLLAALFNSQVVPQSKALIFLFVPLLAIATALLFVHRKRFFAEHLIFATHFFSFITLFFIAVDFVVNKPFRWLTGQQYNEHFDLLSSLAGLVVILLYYAVATRRFYGVGKGYAFFSSIVIGTVFFLGIYGYRMLLFYKIIAAITI